MESAPSLATIPPEMQKEIADALDYKDLAAFRSVSRALCRASEDHFLTAYFGEIHCVFSRSGLTKLADITSQPHLVKGMWMIRLFVVDPESFASTKRSEEDEDADEDEGDGEEHESGSESGDSEGEDDDDGSETDEQGDQELSQKALPSKLWNSEMTDMTKERLDVHLLALTMRNLQACNHKVDFAAMGASGLDVAPGFALGSDDLTEKLGLGEWVFLTRPKVFKGDCSRAMNSIFKAAATTNFSLRGLDLCESSSRGSFTREALHGIHSSTLQSLCRSWEGLEYLMIGFSAGNESFFMSPSYGLKALITSARNLSGLFIYNDGSADEEELGDIAFTDNPLGWLADTIKSLPLRHLRLGGFLGCVGQFTKVLRDHQDTLKILELLACEIPAHECWTSVLQVIVTEMALEDINCNGLYRYPGVLEKVVWLDGANKFSIEQPDAIKEYAARLLAEGVMYAEI